jgi:hypothetical protein
MNHIVVLKDKVGNIIIPAFEVDAPTLQVMLFEDKFIIYEKIWLPISRETRFVNETITDYVDANVTEKTVTKLHVIIYIEEKGPRLDEKHKL